MNPNLYQCINFLKSQDIIEEINGGYSGAMLYKITRNNKRFFLKIFDGEFDEKEIFRIKETLKIYKKLNINSLKIIDYGPINKLKKYYIVYNYIDGKNLAAYTESEQYGVKEVRRFGEIVGKELLKLRKYEKYKKDIFVQSDIDNIVDNTRKCLNLLKNNTSISYFTLDEIKGLESKLEKCCEFVKKQKTNLIHGDLKRGNIMIDEKRQLYIIDVESMQVGYDIMNFKYQMTWLLMNEKEKAFLKGYFDGIYNNTRPKEFNYHIIFIAIVNFINVLYSDYANLKKEEFEVYLKNCRKIFDGIKNTDLEKENII